MWHDLYLYVSAVEVGDGEVWVETDVFDAVRSLQIGEPLFNRSDLAEDIVVDVDFKTEYFSFLELRLETWVTTSTLTLLPTA